MNCLAIARDRINPLAERLKNHGKKIQRILPTTYPNWLRPNWLQDEGYVIENKRKKNIINILFGLWTKIDIIREWNSRIISILKAEKRWELRGWKCSPQPNLIGGLIANVEESISKIDRAVNPVPSRPL